MQEKRRCECGIAQKSTNSKVGSSLLASLHDSAIVDMADTERTPLLEGEEEDHSLLGRISNAVNSPASLNSLEKFLALVAIGLLLISGLSLGLLGGLSAVHGDERSRPRPTATTTTTRTRTHTVLGPTVTSFPNPRKNVSLPQTQFGCTFHHFAETLECRRTSASLRLAYRLLPECSPRSMSRSTPARISTDLRVRRS